jgi:hypothetical protein
VYLYLINVFDSVRHSLLLHRLSSFDLSPNYVTGFEGILAVGRLQLGFISLHSYTMKSGVHEGSILGPLLFSVFINNIYNSVCNSTRILFADNFKTLPLHQYCGGLQILAL